MRRVKQMDKTEIKRRKGDDRHAEKEMRLENRPNFQRGQRTVTHSQHTATGNTGC